MSEKGIKILVVGAGAIGGVTGGLVLRAGHDVQSLERGERTEIDFFNGYIAARGRELGVKTPLNEYLTACVKDIEAGRRKIGLVNFNEPFLEAYR